MGQSTETDTMRGSAATIRERTELKLMVVKDTAHSFEGKRPVSGFKPTGADQNLASGHFAVVIASRRFRIVAPLVAATSVIYLGSLIVLAYFPGVVTHKVVGSVNVAYVLAIAQFVMTFFVAIVYTREVGRTVDPIVRQAFEAARKSETTGATR